MKNRADNNTASAMDANFLATVKSTIVRTTTHYIPFVSSLETSGVCQIIIETILGHIIYILHTLVYM